MVFSSVYEFIYFVIIWLILPAIMLALLFFSIRIMNSVTGSDLKVSARAGFWAGLLFFVVYVVSQLHSTKIPDFTKTYMPNFSWFPIIIGLITGFVFLWIVRLLLPTRFVGLLTLLLALASSTSLYTYFFTSDARDTALFLVLGLAGGILVHIVLFPHSLREL